MAHVGSAYYDYPWLSDRPQGASLEGYLFPDTYELPAETTPAAVVDLMLAVFDARVAPEIVGRLPGRTLYDLGLGAERPMTVRDVMILASIVERALRWNRPTTPSRCRGCRRGPSPARGWLLSWPS